MAHIYTPGPTPRLGYSVIVILRHVTIGNSCIAFADLRKCAEHNWLAYQICISFDGVADIAFTIVSSSSFRIVRRASVQVCKLGADVLVRLLQLLPARAQAERTLHSVTIGKRVRNIFSERTPFLRTISRFEITYA